jgi:hypothetical protein
MPTPGGMKNEHSSSGSKVPGLSYPYDWGFVPSTLGEDGDPLDVMLLHDVTTYPGMMVTAHLIGVLEVNNKELELFFQQTSALNEKRVECNGWQGVERRGALLDGAVRRFRHRG